MQLNERIKIVPESGVTVKKRVADYLNENPSQTLIRLDQNLMNMPLPTVVTEGMKAAVEETAAPFGVNLTSPWTGYDSLRGAVARRYGELGVTLSEGDIFITSGLESSHSTLSNLFAPENNVLIPDPCERHLLELQQMKGRNIGLIRATPENAFAPMPRGEVADLVYLASPDPVTGAPLPRKVLEEWVKWARDNGSVILYDASLSEYLSDPEYPRSIYQIPGAQTVAMELFSFEKGYGVRELKIGYITVPGALVCNSTRVRDLLCARQPATATPPCYVMQRAAELLFSAEARESTAKLLYRIKKVAGILSRGLTEAGIPHVGGESSPFLWVQCPKGMNSWQCFDLLLERASVVVTPGSIFGAGGEQFIRLTSFGLPEEAEEAVVKICAAFSKGQKETEKPSEKEIAAKLFENME